MATPKKKDKSPPVAPESAPIAAYKGFNEGLICRGFKYEIGKEYEHDGDDVELCASGFHACEYPLNVFYYYPPASSVFATVDMAGIVKKGDDKTVSSKITVKASLTLAGLISAAVDYTMTRIVKDDNPTATNTGNYSAATNTGYKSAATNTGEKSAATNTGEHGVAAVFGLASKARAAETGVIVVAWWDEKNERKRLTTGYIGEKGIKPNTWYGCDEKGKLIEIKE